MEALEKLVSNPKLEGGQYGELLGALKKVCTEACFSLEMQAQAKVQEVTRVHINDMKCEHKNKD